MTAKAMISITLAICFLCANGFCLIEENDTIVVLAYQRFNSGGLVVRMMQQSTMPSTAT